MTDPKNNELQPCPFCHSDNLKTTYLNLGVQLAKYWVVECLSCYIMAGVCEDEAQAIKAWNTRATPQSIHATKLKGYTLHNNATIKVHLPTEATPIDALVKAALELAFEAGKWFGQVELEEHYDREQYSQVVPEVFAAQKTAMPNDFASTGRTVRINLRSNEWRDGVKKSAKEYLQKAKALIADAHIDN